MPEPRPKDGSVKGSKENLKSMDNTASSTLPAGEKDEIPPGVRPFFFSAAGQQLFECVVEKDLTSENPHKLIEKAVILEDFRNRAAVSDFHPVKKEIQVGSKVYLNRTHRLRCCHGTD